MDTKEALYLIAAIVGIVAGLIAIAEAARRHLRRVSWREPLLLLAGAGLVAVPLTCLLWPRSRPLPPGKEGEDLLDATKNITTADVLRARRTWAERLGRKEDEEIDLGGAKLKLVLVPPGKFLMGSPPSEQDRGTDEALHAVEIKKPFYLGAYEVTQAQYESVTGGNHSFFSAGRGGGPDHPADAITWDEATAFCRQLSGSSKTGGRICRLPTEAEWEYACREGGAARTAFHYGNALSSGQANIDGTAPYGGAPGGEYRRKTTPVGTFQPNALGLFDMHGNIQEWCADSAPGGERIVRGGSWGGGAVWARSAARHHLPPGYSSYTLGFRIALDVK
jgi:formylglycine-generating enzyme required for sulfatase activity